MPNEKEGASHSLTSTQYADLKTLITTQEKRCKSTIEIMHRRLNNNNLWHLNDEIRLRVAEEKLTLIDKIKSILN